jgi:protein TonB
MEPNKILKADILDLVFEDRNKEYGAYELRKRYNKRMTLALGITGGIALLIVGGSLLAKQFEDLSPQLKKTEVVLEEVKQDEPDEPPPPPPPPPPKPIEPPKVELTKFTPPVIKEDKEVKQEEIPPQEDLQKTNIATISQEGDKNVILAPPPEIENKIVELPKEEPEDKIFEKVEIEASVDQKSWRRHLESQLQRYIEDAASQGMAPGQYTVQVRFLVERDGQIQDVRALNDPGYGLSKGAVEVVKRGPKWNPGEQNGRKVRSYHTQPITFVIAEE